jgi:hypothetical protein
MGTPIWHEHSFVPITSVTIQITCLSNLQIIITKKKIRPVYFFFPIIVTPPKKKKWNGFFFREKFRESEDSHGLDRYGTEENAPLYICRKTTRTSGRSDWGKWDSPHQARSTIDF